MTFRFVSEFLDSNGNSPPWRGAAGGVGFFHLSTTKKSNLPPADWISIKITFF